MVPSYLTQPLIIDSWGVFSTLVSLDPISHLQSNSLANSSSTPGPLIGMLLCMFYAISEAFPRWAFFSPFVTLFSPPFSLMRLGLPAQTHAALSLAFAYFWDPLWFPGKQRSRQPCLDHLLRPNTIAWELLYASYYGFHTSCVPSRFHSVLLSLSGATTRLQSISRPTPYFISSPNI
ncbi:UNVERIFIED_CONTAM: hypothetical protein Sradi_0039800 [Sesamum radiatum]|uniref:Uncharacterized protein n=1 Tax=Sesamum radiatum TaxID=300843 RepID=A0AAW2WGN4_SESRA